MDCFYFHPKLEQRNIFIVNTSSHLKDNKQYQKKHHIDSQQ